MTLTAAVRALAVMALLGGCSDAADPVPRGSLNLQVRAPSISEYASLCQFGTDQVFIAGDSAAGLPNDSEPGPRVQDGDSNSEVSCRVSGSGPYTVQANITRGPVRVAIQGSVPEADYPNATGSGNVYVATSKTVGQSLEPFEGNDCDLTPIEVARGELWARFDCPVLRANVQLNTYCGAFGYISLTDCDD